MNTQKKKNKKPRLLVAQECGQRWYRLSSWRGASLRWLGRSEVPFGPRVTRDGFAVGPVMIFWRAER